MGSVLLCTVTLSSVFSLILAALPANYISLTAEEKQTILINNIKANPYDESKDYPRVISEVDIRLLDVAFLTSVFYDESDELAPGRDKIISPYGVAAGMEYIALANSPYTGIFKSGGVGTMRLSSNGGLPGARIVPFVALKVLIDGQPSQNIHLGYDVAGQISGNRTLFFRDPVASGYDVTVDPMSPEFILKFATALQDVVDQLVCVPPYNSTALDCAKDRPVNIGNLGQVEQASIDRHGHVVARGSIIAPYLVRLVPNIELNNLDVGLNYRKVLVASLKSNYQMFTVEARRSPCDTTWQQIGALFSRSKFYASNYEDQVLRHKQSKRQWDPSFLAPGAPCSINVEVIVNGASGGGTSTNATSSNYSGKK